MGALERIDVWRAAASDANDPHPGVPAHSRNGDASPSTPSARMAELTQHVGVLRGYLLEAVVELKAAAEELQRFHTFQGTSFGRKPMAQHWIDLVVWEAVLNEMDSLGGIIEIGTWQGGFSGWLWAQAELRGAEFITYDAVPPLEEVRNYQRLDVFNHPREVERKISEFERYSPIVVLCDGGNKPRELKRFAPMIQHPDSIIAVHDWGTEMLPENVPDTVEEIHGNYCDQMRSVTRFFKRKEE